MKKVLSLCALAVLCLSACSSNEEKEAAKQAPLVKFEETATVTKNWSASVGSGLDKRYSKFKPAIVGDRIYVADVDGSVFALNRSSGKRIWKSDIDRDVSAAAGANANKVFVGTYSGEVVALDSQSGEESWSAQVSSEILSVPAANNDVVVAQTIDGKAFAFDAQNGSLLWRYDHTVPSLTLRGTANPVIYRNQIYLAFGNGQLVSLQVQDGSLKWDSRLSQPKGRTELEKMIDIDSSPFVSGGLVYAANYQGAVGAFSAAQGQAVWKQDTSTYKDLYAASGRVFVATERSILVALNSGSGIEDWTNELLLNREISSPVAVGDFVAVVDGDGHMHVLNQNDGSFALRFKPSGDGFSAPMIADGDNILVLSDNGSLSSYSFEAK